MTEQGPKITPKDIFIASAMLVAVYSKEILTKVVVGVKEALKTSTLKHNHSDCISRSRRWFDQ